MTQLLVSVRSAAEAEAALAGGAHLIDVKEPAHGSLGRASDQVIGEVLRRVAGRVPVSAALGELSTIANAPIATAAGLAFAKWGLAGLHPASRERKLPEWAPLMDRATVRLRKDLPNCRLVTVAYADYRRAVAPPPAEAFAYALDRRHGPFLLDTFAKDGSMLLDHIQLSEIIRLCRLCHDARLPVALAGSLGPREIRQLHSAEPTWFAVRGAACRGGDRQATIDAGKVRQLVDLLSMRPEAI